MTNEKAEISTSIFYGSCPAPAAWQTSGCVSGRRENFSPPLDAFFTGQGEKDESYRPFRRATRRACYAGNPDSQRRAASFPNALGQRDRNFRLRRRTFRSFPPGHRRMPHQQVRVDHRAAQEIT